MKEIGYCGNHCEHCFLLNVMAVKAIIQAVLMKICLKIRNVLMLFAVKAKTLTAVGNVKMWQTVKQAFLIQAKTMQKLMLYTCLLYTSDAADD